jgi:hypothetical protein
MAERRVDPKKVGSELNEFMRTDGYDWLVKEMTKDCDNALKSLASDTDEGGFRYKQGRLRGLLEALALTKDPSKRLNATTATRISGPDIA